MDKLTDDQRNVLIDATMLYADTRLKLSESMIDRGDAPSVTLTGSIDAAIFLYFSLMREKVMGGEGNA